MYKHSIDDQDREVRALQKHERERLLEVVDDTGLKGITDKKRVTVRALLHSGLRSAELAHLNTGWLDDSGAIPMIRVSAFDCDCGYCHKQSGRNTERTEDTKHGDIDGYWKPKSPTSTRPIPIHYPETWDLLNSYLREHGEERNGELMWDVGTYANWKRVKAVNQHMDLEHDITPHVLRHSFCAMFAAEGEQIGNIAEMAGHKSVDTTRIYAKMTGHQVARQTAQNAPDV